MIWFVMLALPLQGFAAAAMAHCAPSRAVDAYVTASASPHQHDDTSMDMGVSAARTHDHVHGDVSKGHAQAHACCSACMVAMNSVSVALALDGTPVLVPHPELAFPSIVLEGPQRPPRSSFAS